jgi:hypothetical protein
MCSQDSGTTPGFWNKQFIVPNSGQDFRTLFQNPARKMEQPGFWNTTPAFKSFFF